MPAYLIQTGDATVLVDTGPPRDRAGAHRADPDERVVLEPGEDVPALLGRLGVAPDDVDVVVCTHLDPDHAGNHDVFAGAEFVVQRSHHAWAVSAAGARRAAARAAWDRPGVRWTLVDGDTELLPGIELIESGGHVPGHQSVLVRLPETGPVLLAADAIPMKAALDPENRPIFPFDMDEAQVRASTKKLVDLARAEGAMIICGHEPANLTELRAAPAFYG
ncbi:N-acyl homoserine lactonase family protein [Actinomadura rubrobrunea]|uniref:N-acyl homoserine lactonase family protein n=1 Tax=Actinomadura rubrobrunea TaxID=115335 RepID=UPI000831B860|nr:N-acyl homoserine lactonase family protein [Actinomadura rubrobrunea]